ncbi:MAG: lyase family protein [Bdellovibrionota bacterium]
MFSPLDTRYLETLPETLSEEFMLKAQVKVETVWLLELKARGFLKETFTEEVLDAALKDISQDEITEIERTTQHATRALVEAIAARLKKAGLKEAAEWVHVGLTSFDTVDTASRWRLKEFMTKDFFPQLVLLKKELLRRTELHALTPQVGRTHGQWAVPSLFGLLFSESLDRILDQEIRIKGSVENLRGQSSGAIGGYQATSLLVDNPLELEKTFLGRLGLKPAYASSQILPPEDVVNLAQDMYVVGSVIAKLAGDLRHLARSEIAEISEGMAPGQVGSSTMPQKRNPWNFEHICSLYKVLQTRLQLLQIDMVTEHQRDLTNSASGRFYIEFFAVLYLMVHRLNRVLPRMEVHNANMARNIKSAGGSVYAEALYVGLTLKGVEDAHSKVREGAREAEAKGLDLIDVLSEKKMLPDNMTPEKIRARILKGSELKLRTVLDKARKA